MTSNEQPTQLYEIEVNYVTRQYVTVVEAPRLEGPDASKVPNVVVEFARMIARTGCSGPQAYWHIRIGTADLVKLDRNGCVRHAHTMFIWEGH